MSTVCKLETLSIDEYLANELKSDVRHEFINGQIYAMVGASNIHNLIAGSLFASLRSHLNPPCHVYTSDMKVRVDNDFYYPGLSVSCEPVTDIAYYLETPVLIVEVLSPTTEGRDRVEKSLAYRRLSSLKEYVLVSQDKVQVEVLRRATGGWEIETFSVGDNVRFDAVNMAVAIDRISEDVARSIWRK